MKSTSCESHLHDGIGWARALHCLTNSVSLFLPPPSPFFFSVPSLAILPPFTVNSSPRPTHVPHLPWWPHVPFSSVTRGSSDTVCSPCSARLLLHSWSGLEVSHDSGVPPPHHRLLPWPPGPAERLHGGLLRSPSRSRHRQVGVRGGFRMGIKTLCSQTCVFLFCFENFMKQWLSMFSLRFCCYAFCNHCSSLMLFLLLFWTH